MHFLRDCFGHARKDQHGLLGALIRPIFNAHSPAQARDRLSEAVAHLDGRLSKIASMLEDAEPDILAFYAFPASIGASCANPLERFNKEVGRRTDVVGIFPDDPSLIRLAGMLCIEQNDEWLAGRGYLSAESISLVLAGPDDHTHNQIKRKHRSSKRPEQPSSSSTIKAPELLHHVPGLDSTPRGLRPEQPALAPRRSCRDSPRTFRRGSARGRQRADGPFRRNSTLRGASPRAIAPRGRSAAPLSPLAEAKGGREGAGASVEHDHAKRADEV